MRARLAAELDAVDAELRHRYPGAPDRPQPVHTVYVPADRITPDTPAAWGVAARALLDEHTPVLTELDTTGALPAVRSRLESAPIQDLRIDFEDGYGRRDDAEEDAAAAAAGELLATWAAAGAPATSGIRTRGLGGDERARTLRTLEIVLDSAGGVPAGFVFTVPKVRAAEQIPPLVALCEGLERGNGLPDGALRFEVQVETPQLIVAADGSVPVARIPVLAGGRCAGLHFGTYDYTAACGVAAPHQALDHPAADHAKAVMQAAAARTGVWIADGSTQIVPSGAEAAAALRDHHRLVARALRRGWYQGWDMHPGHLVTRWLATYGFFRDAVAVAVPRLRAYLDRRAGGVLDEPATAEALAATVLRALRCGAHTAAEIEALAPELTERTLAALVARAPLPARTAPEVR